MSEMTPVSRKAKSRLGAYAKSPDDVIEHYNREIESRDGYCDRLLLELLQNIEDALNGSEVGTTNAKLQFDGECLWVANKGRAFDIEGFSALCDSNRSPKYGKNFIGNKGTGFKAVLNWTERPEIHSGDIHARFEREEARVQIRTHLGDNIYKEMMGKDGWDGEAPLLRVPLEAKPDDVTQGLLNEGWSTVIKLPIIEGKIQAVKNELESFDPINLLFLRHLKSLSVVINGKNILYERRPLNDGQVALLKEGKELGRYALHRAGLNDLQPKDKKLGGGCEVAISYRTDKVAAESHSLFNFFPIRNAPSPFAGLLIHATFLLEANREYLSGADEEFHACLTAAIAKLLQQVVPMVAKTHGTTSLGILKKSKDRGSGQTLIMHEKLHECIKAIQFIPDLSGEFRTPAELSLWQWNLGELLQGQCNPIVGDRYLCAPDWQQENQAVLIEYGAKSLSCLEHVKAVNEFKPDNMDTSVSALKIVTAAYESIPQYKHENGYSYEEPDKQLALNAIQELALWWTDKDNRRALNNEISFFETLPTPVLEALPNWLQADVLSREFRELLCNKIDGETRSLQERLGGKTGSLWDRVRIVRNSYLHIASKQKILEKALLPALQGKDEIWWENNGNAVMQMLHALELRAEDEYVYKDDSLRQRSSQLIHVPTQDSGWQPAGSVYAGKTWYDKDCPAWGEMLSKLPNRFLLAESNEWLANDAAAWSGVLRYIGVSWLPKFALAQEGEPQSAKNGLKGQPTAYVPKNHWGQFVEDILLPGLATFEAVQSKEAGRWKVSTDAIEGLDLITYATKEHGQLLCLLQQLHVVIKKPLTTKVVRRGPYGGGTGFKDYSATQSFLEWQVRNAQLFPVDTSKVVFVDSNSATPSNMFMVEGRNWKAWLPRLELSGIKDENDLNSLRTFANQKLGAFYKTDDVSAEVWWRWLIQLQERFNGLPQEELSRNEENIGRFMADLGKALSGKEGIKIPDGIKLPCRTAKGIEFKQVDECYVLDEHRWEPLRESLINDGENLLLVSLNAGQKLAALFDCKNRLLSNALKIQMAEHLPRNIDVEGKVNLLISSSEKKARILALIEHSVHAEKAEQFQAWQPEIRVVDDLQVIPSLRGRKLDPVSLLYHWDDGCLWACADNSWSNLAQGICQKFDLKNNLDDALDNLFGKLGRDMNEADSYLRGKQIDEQTVAKWLDQSNEPPSESPELKKENKEGKEDILKPVPPEDPPIVVNPPVHVPGPIDIPTPPECTPPRGGGTHNPAGQKQGKDAEEWMLARLKSRLPENEGWSHALHARDIENRETDILLKHPCHGEFHVEVKSMSGSLIYWSRNEVAKAQDHSGKYFMVILCPRGGREFEEYWFSNPLEQLSSQSVEGIWLWNSNENTGLVNALWEMPNQEPDLRYPNNHSFKVFIPTDWLNTESAGFEEIKKLLETTKNKHDY